MSYFIKIIQPGFDVSGLDKKPSSKKTDRKLSHILSTLALPYLYGAKTQIVRYKMATSLPASQKILAAMQCLHESSTLFEDLNTVARYVKKCGYSHESHELWYDIRNHIRHDVREEFDNQHDERKKQRAKRLNLDQKLQIDISFSNDVIRIGNIIVKISDIEIYLAWASKIFEKILSDAQKDGLIKKD